MRARKVNKRIVGVLLAILLVQVGLAVPAHAYMINGPVFTVMNTSETPPDGVYFRNSPHTNDTNRVYGLGVFMNEQVQYRCFSWGDAVGQYSNQLWYYVNNVSRPTNYDGEANQGYLNAHYVSDGMSSNQIYPGIPDCSAAAPGPPPPPPQPSHPSVTLAQGPAASSGYWYAIGLRGFAGGSSVSVTCYDSVSPGGFRSFSVSVDGSGNANTANECRSNDGPDHWVAANGVSSNHVGWSATSSPVPAPPQQPQPPHSPPSGPPPETCKTYSGVPTSGNNLSEWLLGHFEDGYSSDVVVPWSYFAGNPQFVKEAKSIGNGQQVIGWQAVFPSDMFFALGHFTIHHDSPHCYSIFDIYDFSKLEFPFWLQQRLKSAVPFKVYSSGWLD